MKPEIIETPQQLEALCDDLAQESCIAIDTEFARETTYFPHLGLVQLAGRERIACIDPLAFDAKPQLVELLLDTSVTKVFHACQQDLEVLELTMGDLPCPLYDTQLAFALMNENHQISYAKLVENELGIKLPKTETRTNWLKRPLTNAQLEYAADDVRYLLEIYQKQQTELQNLDRASWLENECNNLCSQSCLEKTDFSNCWTRVRGKQKLRPGELAVLQEAAIWREQQAITNDMPRRRLLPDDLMIQIATNQPKNSSELSRLDAINRFLDPVAIDSLAEAVSTAYSKPKPAWPSNKRRPFTPDQNRILTAVLDHLKTTSTNLGISQGMLCNRKNAEKLVLGERDLAILKGWRLDFIGNQLLELLAD